MMEVEENNAMSQDDDSSDTDSSDSSEVQVQVNERDNQHDPDTFECLPNGGPTTISKDSADYAQYQAEFDALLEVPDSTYDVTNYRQFVNMSLTLNDLEGVRKACVLYCSKFSYDEPVILPWLYRELREYIETQNKDVLEYMWTEIFQKYLNERYSRLIVYKLAHFTKYYPNPSVIWDYIFDRFVYDFVSPTKLMTWWLESVDRTNAEVCAQIVSRYESLVSIPHLDVDKTYVEFKVLVTKEPEKYVVENWDYVQEDFEKAQTEADLMVAYENELDLTTEASRATMYKLYLNEVGQKLDRKVRRFIYERMISECSDSSCWLMYIDYLIDRQLDEDLEQVLQRALRLSDPHDRYFILRMDALEKRAKKTEMSAKDTRNELTKILEEAGTVRFTDPDQNTRIWLEYLAMYRRLTDAAEEKEVELLRKNFDLAWNSLSRQWGDAADRNGEILKFQARLEFQILNNPSEGRNLWNMVLTFGENSQNVAIWLEYIGLEEAVSHTSARKLYKRALHTPELLDPETLSNAWQRFERVHGDTEQLRYCQEHCRDVLDKYYKELERQAQREEQQEQRRNNHSNHKGDQFKGDKRELKRKPDGRNSARDQPERKKTRKGEEKGKPTTSSKSSENTGRAKEEVEPPLHAAPVHAERNEATDYKKVFVSNLDYTVTEEEIRATFPELAITTVDLVKNVAGKSRGFCYVELADEQEVQKALGFDRRPINGRPTYVSSCLREKTQREKKFNYSEALEPTKLFVKGCSMSTQDQLQELFGQFGKIKEVRMVYHKSGKSKGIAFIDYETQAEATAALLKLDQYELNGQILSVSLSSPPPRGQMAMPPAPKVISLGNAKKSTTRGDMKPRLSFIPSSVLKKTTIPK